MNKLFIIRGIPGSGKSTLAKKLAEEVFEADQFFLQNGEYRFEPSKIKEAHQDCQRRTEEAMRRGVSTVAVANTFTQKWEYHKYLSLAVKYGYAVEIKVCRGDYQNIHGVPDDIVEKMRKRFEE